MCSLLLRLSQGRLLWNRSLRVLFHADLCLLCLRARSHLGLNHPRMLDPEARIGGAHFLDLGLFQQVVSGSLKTAHHLADTVSTLTDLIFHLARGMAEEGHPGGVLGGARGNLLHDNDERQNHLVIPVPGFISRLSGGILRRARNGTSQPSLRRGWIATRSTLRYQRLDIIDSSDLTMPSRSPT